MYYDYTDMGDTEILHEEGPYEKWTEYLDEPLIIYYEYDDENRIITETREAWGNKAVRNKIYEGDLLVEIIRAETVEYAYTYDKYDNMIKEYSNIGGTEKENKWEYTYE